MLDQEVLSIKNSEAVKTIVEACKEGVIKLCSCRFEETERDCKYFCFEGRSAQKARILHLHFRGCKSNCVTAVSKYEVLTAPQTQS